MDDETTKLKIKDEKQCSPLNRVSKKGPARLLAAIELVTSGRRALPGILVYVS